MKRKVLVSSLLVPIFIFGLIGITNAQSVNEAAEAYNTAYNLVNTDPVAGITYAKQALEICEQLGDEGTDVNTRTENLMPSLYFYVGNFSIKAKKYTQAIKDFQEALKVSEQYKNQEYITKSKSMIPKLYNSVGGSYYKQKKYDEAIEALNKAIVYDPDYAKAYYTMGLVYKKMNDAANFETTMDKGVVAATNSKDNKTKGQITKAANSFFLTKGSRAFADGKADEATPMLNSALKYAPKNIDTYFYLSSAYNDLKQYDLAIEAANKALELQADDNEKEAKHYYNLGLAYKGKGDKTAACEAFTKALFGQFKENAQYEIEHGVKCKE